MFAIASPFGDSQTYVRRVSTTVGGGAGGRGGVFKVVPLDFATNLLPNINLT